MAGTFTLASFDTIIWVLLSVQHALGPLPLPEGLPNTHGHTFPMDIYPLGMAAAVIEWLYGGKESPGWLRPG